MNERMKATRNALADVKIAIHKDEARLDGMQQDLGDALAAARVGERGAQKKASSLSMDVGKLKSSLDSLRSEERALERRLAQLEEDHDANEAEAARERIRALKQRTEEAENEFAALLDQAWDVGRELLQLDRQWNAEMRRDGFTLKEEMPVPPKSPVRLSNVAWYKGDRDEEHIDRWKNPVKPRQGTPKLRHDGDPLHRSPVHYPTPTGRVIAQGDRAFVVSYEDAS